MNNWAKDYLKYTNETGGRGSQGGSGGGSRDPGCGGILLVIPLISLIMKLIAGK